MKVKVALWAFVITLIITSCETSDDTTMGVDNSSQIEELDNLLAEIQIYIPPFARSLGRTGGQLTRIDYMFGASYEESYSPESTSSQPWNIAYLNLFPLMEQGEEIAVNGGHNKHLGVIKVLRAYTLLNLVDFYGDVPFSEISEPSPSVDDGATLYGLSLQMLDEAISALEENGANLENDYYYNNNFVQWGKLANTLKMNAYLNTRLVDASAISNFQAIVNSGDFITTTNDDFQFKYGMGAVPEDDIHPDYKTDYQTLGVFSYQSNWLMNKMISNDDPRRRYYFYRQTDCTPGSVDAAGNVCESSPETLHCSVDSAPGHYTVGMAFCSIEAGYWGRDHGQSLGIPPDSFTRTAHGLYPAAGKFDDDDYSNVESGSGGVGAGIIPIMLASWVDFMQAEIALTTNNTGAADGFIQSGLQKSIDKVTSFVSLDPDADLSYEPSGADISAYITNVAANFSNASTNEKWNILAEQQFIANFGNGISAYNTYRRTGYPTSLQFHLEATPGAFVRSLYYPPLEVNNNSNIDQKPNLGVQVFWDTNPSYPNFPLAN